VPAAEPTSRLRLKPAHASRVLLTGGSFQTGENRTSMLVTQIWSYLRTLNLDTPG